jgi:lipase chaperone LimK
MQVTVSDAVREYLQLKAELTGKPEATLMGELAFDAMKQEFADLLDLKIKLDSNRHATDTTNPNP